MTPDYQQALEWATEWITEKHPEILLVENCNDYWANEFTEFHFFKDEFETPCIRKVSVEIFDITIFRFIIPATKQEFFSVLNILDKQEI